MALQRLFLAAQEACLMQQFRGNFPFNLSCGKQCQKVPLVNRPASLAFLEGVHYLLRRRQVRTMEIIDPADRPEEIAKIIPLGETGQLRDVVESYVDHSLDTRPDQQGKELLRRLLGETDGKYLNLAHHFPVLPHIYTILWHGSALPLEIICVWTAKLRTRQVH